MEKKTIIFLSIAGALSGIAAFFSYVQGANKRKLEEDVLALDKQIKMLQLVDRQNSRITV